ncbi:MAG: hypothetical protein FJ029_05150, partial [Actinobacteria bacterium]|nr:hypothetical protein [Actinomycetota bacterium]
PGEIRIEYRDRAVEEVFQAFNTYVAEVENFGDAIQGRAALVVSGEEGVRNVRVLAAIRASAQSGARVAP